MATNQRENERKERKEKKQQKMTLIFWCVVLVIVLILLVMKLCEIDYTELKQQLSAKISSSQSVSDDEKFPYALEGSEDAVLSEAGNKIAVLSSNSFSVVDPSDAELLYSENHGFSNPVMKAKGNYCVLFDQGAEKYRLDTAGGNVYYNTAENTILCADVSESGTVAMALTSSESKSEIVVLNKSLSEKLRYSVASGYVTDIAVDASANRIAFAVISSDNARFQTTVYTMLINDDAPKAEFTYHATVLDIRFSGSKLFVAGTDFVSVISSMKTEEKIFEQGSVNVSSVAYNSSGSLILAYTDYSGQVSDHVACIQPSGNIKTTIETGKDIKHVTASSSEISVLTDDSVITYSIRTGEVKDQLPVDDSYSSLLQLSSKIFAKHRSYIELLTD